MPELPEVETMCRGIAGIVGSRITGMRMARGRLQPIQIAPRLSEFRRRVLGQRIDRVGRAGKRVVLELEGGDRIVLEPRMTGLVLLACPPDTTHLRIVFGLSNGDAAELLFWDQRGLGVVRLTSASQFTQFYGPKRLGPDALDISAKTLCERLGASRSAIKVALLDQRRLAGVGNLYASEILHRAGLHPGTACNRLRPNQWRKLHTSMVEVLREAIVQQGSTLRDGTYRIARSQPGSYQFCHAVYQRAGQPCVRCGRAAVVRIVQAQRSTFFCPACQRKPRRG
jgi:formamidopyrimidine-DNA glycosylase